MSFRPRRMAAATFACLCLLALTGCGSSDSPSKPAGDDVLATPLAQVTSTPPADAVRIDATITADSVSPDGERLDVKVGQPVVISIDATAAGELHVHSSPEQHLAYPSGKSQLTLTFDRPGVIAIESHALEKQIAQLEVR